ncbi:hypothetical protein AB4Y88_16165, partial [Paenarthrobacter sp. RAF9]
PTAFVDTVAEKNFHHHAVGELTLSKEGMELTAEPGLSFLIYTAESGSPSEERLKLLASLTATAAQETTSQSATGAET